MGFAGWFVRINAIWDCLGSDGTMFTTSPNLPPRVKKTAISLKKKRGVGLGVISKAMAESSGRWSLESRYVYICNQVICNICIFNRFPCRRYGWFQRMMPYIIISLQGLIISETRACYCPFHVWVKDNLHHGARRTKVCEGWTVGK